MITLLPSRYSADTVGRIIEALYCAYALTYDGQFGYIRGRNRGERLVQGTFAGRVEIGTNPGLNAVLAEDVCVQVVSRDGKEQSISWTDPDYYEARGTQRPVRLGPGQFHKLKFDYRQNVQNEVA